MKKTLLLIILGAQNFISAQTLQSEIFNSLTIGNVGTDLTGVTPGQGGMYTYVAASGNNTNFQIVNEGGAYANVLQIVGSATASNSRFLWKDGLATAWSTRTVGNNIIQVEYDFFTGAATTSKNQIRIALYDVTGAKVLAGLTMTQDTKIIQGIANYDNAGTIGNYLFNLGASGATLPLTANTWVRVGFTFNKTTGEVIWKGPGFYSGVNGAATGIDPDEIDFLLTAGTGNTVSSTAKFDNFSASAVLTESLLGVENFQSASLVDITLFPNPVNNILNINSLLTITKVQIIDLNGRIVKKIEGNNPINQINVSDLFSGVYLLNIETEEGFFTKKIVKN